jgi:hypothetical protein
MPTNHVQPWRTIASQKRLAENFGWSTSVPPDHSVLRVEYEIALV